MTSNLANRKQCKRNRKWPKCRLWVLIYEYSERAIQWIPTWQGLEVFQKYLRPCALDRSSLSIGRVRQWERVFNMKFFAAVPFGRRAIIGYEFEDSAAEIQLPSRVQCFWLKENGGVTSLTLYYTRPTLSPFLWYISSFKKLYLEEQFSTLGPEAWKT